MASACSSATGSMFIYGGYYSDPSGYRITLNDVWEWVFSYPTQYYNPSTSSVVTWRGGWRKVGTSLTARMPRPAGRFGAAATMAAMPWYWLATRRYRGDSASSSPLVDQSEPLSATRGWGWLDMMVVTGGQVDGWASFISSNPAEDNTWVLLLEQVEANDPIANQFPLALPPRNGSWMQLQFDASSASQSFSLWSHGLTLSGGDRITMVAGLAPLSSQNDMGQSMTVAKNNVLSLSVVADIEQQVNNFAFANNILYSDVPPVNQSRGDDGNGGSQSRSTNAQPPADETLISSLFCGVLPSWSRLNSFLRRFARFLPFASTVASRDGRGVGAPVQITSRGWEFGSDPRFAPRFGASACVVNVTDVHAAVRRQPDGQIMPPSSTNVLIFGGQFGAPVAEVWLLDTDTLPTRSLTASDVDLDLSAPPGIQESTLLIGLLSTMFCLLAFMCMGLHPPWISKARNACLACLLCVGLPLPGQCNRCRASARTVDWEMIWGTGRFGAFCGPLFALVCRRCCGCRPTNTNIYDDDGNVRLEDELEFDSDTGEVRVRSARARVRLAQLGVITAASLRAIEAQAQREVVNERRGAPEDAITSLPTFTFSALDAVPEADVNAIGSGNSGGASSFAGGIRSLATYFRKATTVTTIVTVDVTGPSCPICLGDYEGGDPLKRLPCAHFFHQACIDRWLRQSGKTCPMCKHSILDPFLPALDQLTGAGRASQPPSHGRGAAAASIVNPLHRNSRPAESASTQASGSGSAPPVVGANTAAVLARLQALSAPSASSVSANTTGTGPRDLVIVGDGAAAGHLDPPSTMAAAAASPAPPAVPVLPASVPLPPGITAARSRAGGSIQIGHNDAPTVVAPSQAMMTPAEQHSAAVADAESAPPATAVMDDSALAADAHGPDPRVR